MRPTVPLLVAWAFLAPGRLPAAPAALLNEVAPEETAPGSDWIEMYVASGPLDLSGWQVHEKSDPVKTFPGTDFTLPSGAFLLLHFKSSEEDEIPSEDRNGNGAVDLYSADSGLTGTSNAVSLRDRDGKMADAVVYSDGSSWTSSQQEAFDLAVASGVWTGTLGGGAENGFRDSVLVPGGIGPGNSIGRRKEAGKGDAASGKDAWRFFKLDQTPGRKNPAARECPPGSGPVQAVLTEAAPSIPRSSGGDFIELWTAAEGDLCGLRLYEGGTLVKTFPSVRANSGPFGRHVLVHAGEGSLAGTRDETLLSGDKNGDGVVDLFSDETSPGLTGSAFNTLTLTDPEGKILDFISYSRPDGLFSSDHRGSYDAAVRAGIWQPSCENEEADCYPAGSVPWENSPNLSMSRKAGPAGSPEIVFPGSAAIWAVGPQSPGRGYGSPSLPQEEILKVTQSPFSPVGDGAYREAVIAFRAPEKSLVDIGIYDSRGRKVRSLLESHPMEASGTGSVAWDGRDSSGSIAPVGLYIVNVEIRRSGGDRSSGRKTVVLGRKL
ncbi:MAG: hypothetical protein A2636_05215 [Elusimicrobia bacterium RIFCSPHIGHO2_01_FULL_64_10]|nr:MAG: hypothetical protein A2636_05215 [Elusimicrobia bacterium RIFCSPHIGHO2_01_FULL_64_10]